MPDHVQNAPEVSFIDGRSVDDIRTEMVADFERSMSEAAGQTVRLERASVHRMILYAAAAQIYQAMQYIDRAGKQNLLKYSYGHFLDNLGRLKGVTRSPAAHASTTLRFTLSAPRETTLGIPAGTRASDGGTVFFATAEYQEIPPGSLSVESSAVCTIPGLEGNGFQPGDLRILVDPVPYVGAVENISLTEGGADAESDEDLAERIFLAPSAYSTAGPENSYRYHAKAYSPAVGDVAVTSDQEAGRVDIVFLLSDGSIPGPEMAAGLQEYLRDNNIRPLTDLVTVSAPERIPYSLEATYYINRSDSAQAMAIQAAVRAAVDGYITWQRTIGRDINPSKLVSMMIGAGVKRVEVAAPVFTRVPSTAVADLSEDPVLRYGGWKMTDLRGSRFTSILPEHLRNPETQALAYAVGRQVEQLLSWADRVPFYAMLSSASEAVLDYLAVELRTPAYSEAFSVEVKRALIQDSILAYAKMGTPAAIDRTLAAIFQTAHVQEWFDYGGEPHHFQALVQADDGISQEALEICYNALRGVKRLSSWLDGIHISANQNAVLNTAAHLERTVCLDVWPCVVNELESGASLAAAAHLERTVCLELWPQVANKLECAGSAALAGALEYHAALELYPIEEEES